MICYYMVLDITRIMVGVALNPGLGGMYHQQFFQNEPNKADDKAIIRNHINSMDGTAYFTSGQSNYCS